MTTDYATSLALLNDDQLEQALENSFMLPPEKHDEARRAIFQERSRRQMFRHLVSRVPQGEYLTRDCGPHTFSGGVQ